MSTGVKKPPLAPKPKLPVSTKPSPPPIAPKPGALPHTTVSTQPSPTTFKRAKPAVAPKPCIPKSAVAHPPQQVSGHPTISQEQNKHLEDKLSLLNSKNGMLSETGKHESDYIIPFCSCGLQDCLQCSYPENRNENGNLFHKDESDNGIVDGLTGTSREHQSDNKAEVVASERSDDKGANKKPRDKPQRQRHLGVNKDARRSDDGQETRLPADQPLDRDSCHTCSVSGHEVAKAVPETEISDDADFTRDSTVVSLPPHDPEPAAADSVFAESTSPVLSLTDEHFDTEVPTAPSKPLPVPQPRKFRKPVLVRQDGVESSAQDLVEEHKEEVTVQLTEQEPAEPPHSTEDQKPLQHLSHNSLSQQDSDVGCDESDAPVPPPRQTSLSPRLQRSTHIPPTLNKNASHSLNLISQTERMIANQAQHCMEQDEEDGYGDFKRYPITHSLPKQIKLGCQVPLGSSTMALSAEDQHLMRAPPRKPQRHSLPVPPPPSICPPAPPHGDPPMRELPSPPQERAAWRFSRPCLTFFSRQMPTRSSMPPKSRAPMLGCKQRAQSFSAADLATRVSAQKRGLSFRKLLELRMSVKMLPKLLGKSGPSSDGTSMDPNLKNSRSASSTDETDNGGESGDGSVEYENVPLYEEIPEYMNLPFHSARLGWPQDADGSDTDIYEVQDPYHRRQDGESDSDWPRRDVHSEAEEIHSSDEEDNSSTSSKEQIDVVDKQQEDEMKRKKVVHIAQEIMSSEKVFVDVLKLLHIDFRDAVTTASRQNGKPVVEERVLSQILYYLPQLYQLNRDLLRELEERVAHWSDHQRLSDIFVQKGPYLKMYSTYIRQFDNNVALLDEQCRKNPAFAAVVRDFEMTPRCASLALKHYLLKPVQRIPQYQLLLTDYLKNLPEDSEDYKDTQAALSIVKEVANHANDIMKQGDNFQKLMQIQYSLNGHHEIVQPGRVYLKEGTLMKLSRKVMQPRVFFLFNDALMYTTPNQSGQYKLNSVLPLAGMKVSKPSQEAYQNELNIESVERSFILSASSAPERDEWLEAIAKAIDDYTKKKITFISTRSQEEADVVFDSGAPLGSKAPIWIPDLRATMCMICTCEFTLTWRRHHCRACGKVVCQACSANKYYLEYLKNQPARVCDHCFAKLQENSDRCASTSVSPIKSGAFSFTRKQKKIPAALKEVSANTENSSMSGYLNRSKGIKKPWKRLWFVIKNKVLYTYAASEDVAALESQPLLGFFLREEKNGPAQKMQFKLYHKNTLFYIFRADDIPTAQRWIEAFQEAMILEE
ncbi:FYVE, RhoGEF and PH domain-containing protein 6 [Synchiropus picturatus]